MDKRFGKRELLLLLLVFAALLVLWFGVSRWHGQDGGRIRITVGGETIGEYSLSSAREIPIEVDGEVTNTLVIADGQADMVWADCPDQTCVKTKPISALKETIVCLPHQIVVEVISSDEEAEFDVIAQ